MQQRREDAEGGVNAFIQEQAEEPERATLTLVQFDTEYEILHRGLPIEEVPEYRLEPRGMTALLDAVGRAINETGIRLKEMKKADRPGLVIFVITTDGLENSTTEFTRDQIREMIEHQQQVRLAFHVPRREPGRLCRGGAMGMRAGAVANFAMDKVGTAYEMTSRKVSRMRAQKRSGQEVVDEFTDEERKSMM